ncbi:MAG TPA: CHAD domain-containing protein [Candidatus Acidoferrales bacterium]|nr:CHAD domain-containing protein [Candidatus Acidoferrales bacterium]
MSKSLSKTDITTGITAAKPNGFAPKVNRGRIAGIPKPDTIQILLRSFGERHQIFANQLAKTRKRATEKAVHDLRVSTRRLIAVTDLVRIMIPGTDISKTRKQLKRLLSALSELRDVQVQIMTVRSFIGEFPALNLFLTLLMVREKQFLRRAHAELHSFLLKQIDDGIARTEERLQTVLADQLLRDAARSIVVGKLARTFSRAVQLKPAALSGKGNRIHRLRIAFKRFRYTVEALEAILPNVTTRTKKAMNAYQVRMGNIQDTDVLIASIRDHAKKHPRADQEQFRRLIDNLMNRRRELVLEFVSSVDELNLFWKKLGKVE